MIKSFNKDEKMILIAILKCIVSADGNITSGELERFNDIAEKKGFEDFQEIFNEVDKEIKNMDDVKELIKKVTNNTHKKDILKFSIDIAIADGNINPDEADVLNYMSKEWGIDVKSLLPK